MHDIALLKNGRVIHITKKKHMKKLKKNMVQHVLLECMSWQSGRFYAITDYKGYNKFRKDVKKTKISYDFINGTVVDDEDEEMLKVHYSIKDNSVNKVVARLQDIEMKEYFIQDTFGCESCYFAYYFTNIKIKIWNAHNKVKEFTNMTEFFKKYGIYGNKGIGCNDALLIKNGKWKVKSLVQLKNTPKDDKEDCYFMLYGNYLYHMDKAILKKNISFNRKLLLVDDTDIDDISYEEYNSISYTSNHSTFYPKLFECYIAEDVMSRIDIDGILKCKTKVKVNGKKKKLEKVIYKYFLDIIGGKENEEINYLNEN